MAKPQQPPQLNPAPPLDDGATMPLGDHLRELRVRLRNSIAGLLVGFGIAYWVKEEIFAFIARPLIVIWSELKAENQAVGEPQFVFHSLMEPFWTYFALSLWAGAFIASPIIFHQIWKFIAPGLYQHERRYGIYFAFFSAICFTSGAVFCYMFVLPHVYAFFLDFSSSNLSNISTGLGDLQSAPPAAIVPYLSMGEYLSFARNFLLAFGVVFELPLLIFFLALVGMVTHRSLWRFNRWWVVISFIIGAVLTPTPDVVSQLFLAGPLVVLYNISILLAYVVTKRREAKEAAEMAGG